MSGAVIEAVLAALGETASRALSAAEIARRVSKAQGAPITRAAITAALSSHLCTNREPALAVINEGRGRRFTLGSHATPADAAEPLPRPALPFPKTLTAALLGDPLPGRSALDQLRASGAATHA